jgi:hypothetical protein
MHTVGDVDLSPSLGIDFGCAGYESKYDKTTPRDGTTEGCVASLKDVCGEKNNIWKPF